MSEPGRSPHSVPPGSRPGVDPKLVAAIDRVGHALRVQMGQVARDGGLTPTQLQLLVRLQFERPESARVGVLAAELDLTPATVSDSLRALERKGLVERVRDPVDGRGVRLTLTWDGHDVAARADSWRRASERLLVGMSLEDKERALGVLIDLIGALHRDGILTVARTCVTCRYFVATGGASDGHRCAFLDATLGPSDLRVDCPEHEPLAA